MLRHRHIDRIILLVLALTVALTAVLMFGEQLGIPKASASPGYVNRLFDSSYVHRVDLVAEDWQTILDDPHAEEYIPCTVVIDGEKFENVGLRAKGNNSMRLTEKYGHDRYSLKLEFDHFAPGSYFGLDKLALDASFQDNSYLKSYLTYSMMAYMGVPAPLVSYTWVTVNGQDWGLFLAIEEPEEAFARRNFGDDYGKLYKPDYKNLDQDNPDVALQYTGEDYESYDNIFRYAKFKITDTDRDRLIAALKILDSGEQLDRAVDIEEMLRYFTVQVFVVNLDSYLGHTGHNYFLYEKDGILQMLPWDYNLAFGTYSLGMPNPINDSTLYINYPINTPGDGSYMQNRPMFHKLMLVPEHFHRYHTLFDAFLSGYFESGWFGQHTREVAEMIGPYVEKDPTAFCSYEDHLTGVETIVNFCLLRAQSVRGQLEGTIPATIKAQAENPDARIDGSTVWLPDLGEVEDLRNGIK